MKKYYLMNEYDKVLEFGHDFSLIGDVYEIYNIFDESQLPIDLRKKENLKYALLNWVNSRAIPVNRHHMEAILGAINLENRFDILYYSHGLSLNDTFWVQEITENLNFDHINLYDNPFDEALGWIAFTGLPSNISRHLSTPEITTEGMLPKFWQRVNTSNIILCKGGTEGFSNAGLEPYAEVIASIIAKHLEVNSISYHLEKRNKKYVSISKLFTTREFGLLTANKYFKFSYPNFNFISLEMALEKMRKDFKSIKPFYDMCFFDYIIENSDRHLNNWGFKISNKNQEIQDFSVLWDNGMSLDFEKPEDLRKRIDFASFNVKYDFVKTCEFKEDYLKKCSRLMRLINNGSLYKECFEAVKGFEIYEKRIYKTLEFLNLKCEKFIK